MKISTKKCKSLEKILICQGHAENALTSFVETLANGVSEGKNVL